MIFFIFPKILLYMPSKFLLAVQMVVTPPPPSVDFNFYLKIIPYASYIQFDTLMYPVLYYHKEQSRTENDTQDTSGAANGHHPPKKNVPLFFKRGHRERKFRSMNTHVYVQANNSCMFQSFSLFRRALFKHKIYVR